jgi:hypothetical protein
MPTRSARAEVHAGSYRERVCKEAGVRRVTVPLRLGLQERCRAGARKKRTECPGGAQPSIGSERLVPGEALPTQQRGGQASALMAACSRLL